MAQRIMTVMAQATVTIQQFEAAITAHEGAYDIAPPSSMEDWYEIAGNNVNSGIESLVAHITRDDNFSQFDFDEALVLAHQDVVDLLLDEQAHGLADLEEHTGKSIRLQTEALYLQDQFDVVLI